MERDEVKPTSNAADDRNATSNESNVKYDVSVDIDNQLEIKRLKEEFATIDMPRSQTSLWEETIATLTKSQASCLWCIFL